MNLPRGTVVRIDFDPVVGHEQGRLRPAIVVSDTAAFALAKYPLVAVVPLTSKPRSAGPLYPVIRPKPGTGLVKPSVALVDNVRSVDVARVTLVAGAIRDEDLAAVDAGLRLLLGL